jgi:predicted enzyme related to lactoylglutathione lyase
MSKGRMINYTEFPACDLQATKAFFSTVFKWSFEDFGTEYIAFSEQGIEGKFFKSNQQSLSINGAALVIFYSANLESTLNQITSGGGVINKAIFFLSRRPTLSFHRA